MNDLILVKHAQGAPGLRLFGVGHGYLPLKGMTQLIKLFHENTSWAQDRSRKGIKKMLAGSKVVVSGWYGKNLVGFGRATTDDIYRAVLWDIIIDKKYENNGIGSKIISSILSNKFVSKVERIYVMTTHCKEFYLKMNFNIEKHQKLLILKN